MKMRVVHVALLAASAMTMAQVQAADGYWNAMGDTVWRSGSGDCLHTNYWNPDMAIVGCDGKVAEAPPAPVVEVAPVPEPVAMVPVEATVNFAFDSADLNASATSAIDSLVSQAKFQHGV